MKHILSIVFIFLLVASFARIVSAQEITGEVRGIVKDPSGAVIAGASVNLINVDRGTTIRSVMTGGNGSYVLPYIPVGHYQIEIDVSGFEKYVAKNIIVNVSDRLTIDAALKLGKTGETVTVTDTAAAVDLTSAQSAGLISGVQVRDLAVSSRNFIQLVALQPGVTSNMASSNLYIGASNPTGKSNQINMSVNGNRPTQNNWTIDGADNFDRGSNLTLLNYPSIDSIAEFKVARSGYLAEQGRSSAGAITVVTRGGTNKFSGTVYEFFRNDALNGNDYFNKNVSDPTKVVPRSPQRWNDFGFTLGGPIKKGRTYFFYSQEWKKIIYYPAGALSAYYPSAAMMQGNFAGTQADKVCVSFDASGNCLSMANSIPTTSMDPTAQAYIKNIYLKMPTPNRLGTSGTSPLIPQQLPQLQANGRNLNNYREEAIRIDQNITKKLSIFGRYTDDAIPTEEAFGLYTGVSIPGLATTQSNTPAHNLTVRGTYLLSDTLIADFGYAYSYGKIDSTPIGTEALGNATDIHTNLIYPSNSANVPFVNLGSLTTGPWGSIVGTSGFGPYGAVNRNDSVFGNVTKIAGHHSMKYGGTIAFYKKNEPNTNPATFYFSDGCGTGCSSNNTYEQTWANFLLGRVAQYSQTNFPFLNAVRQKQYEAFAQDEWRLTQKLTLTLGARYSLFMQPTYANGMLSTFDAKLYDPMKAANINPANGQFVVGTSLPYSNGIIIGGKNSPLGDAVAPTPKFNIGPRVGFAWDPYGNGTTSVRGGYGIFFDSPAMNSTYQFESGNVPLAQTATILNTNFTNPGSVGSASINLQPPSIGGPNPNYWKQPSSQMFSFDIQHSFTQTMTLDLGYAGNLGRHLMGVVDVNMPHAGDYMGIPGYANHTLCKGGYVPATGVCTFNGASGSYQLLNYVRPYKGYNAINLFTPAFTSNYNALQAQFSKQFSSSAQIALNYTFSHALTTASTDFSAAQYSYNLRGDYGNANQDRRQVFTANYVYTLPFYKSGNGLKGHALGGWQLSGLAYINSGQHFTPTLSGCTSDPAGLGTCGPTYSGSRPDATMANPNTGKRIAHNASGTAIYWATNTFVPVPAGQKRPGNASRGSIVGPGTARWDASVFKNTKITEGVNMQFRVEGFNVLNHTNFGLGSPASSFVSLSQSSSSFGQIQNAYEPRQLQVAIKIKF